MATNANSFVLGSLDYEFRFPNLAEPSAASMASLAPIARQKVEDFREEVIKLTANPDLTVGGVARKLTAYAQKEIDALELLANKQISAARLVEENSLTYLNTLPSVRVDAAIEVECRTLLLAMDPLVAGVLVAQALAEHDLTILQAVVGAPSFLKSRLVPAGVSLAEIELALTSKRNGTTARKLADIREGIAATKALIETAKRLIIQTPGLTAETKAALDAWQGNDVVAAQARAAVA